MIKYHIKRTEEEYQKLSQEYGLIISDLKYIDQSIEEFEKYLPDEPIEKKVLSDEEIRLLI